MEADLALGDMEIGRRAEFVVDVLAEGGDAVSQLVEALNALEPAERTMSVCDAIGEARKRADRIADATAFELASRLRGAER